MGSEMCIRDRESETLFIAVKGNDIVGCVFAAPCGAYVYLGKLAVHSNYRGQGIARRLIQQVEILAVQTGTGCVEIETRIELTENQQQFEHLGYIKIAENAHPGFQRTTSLRYRKTL